MSNIRVRLLTSRHETVQSKLNNLIEEFLDANGAEH